MEHLGTARLETERLILRRFRADDGEAMFRNWASDGEVTKFLTWQTHGSKAVSDMVIADWVSRYSQDDYYQWAVELKEIGEPIGSIAVVRLFPEADGVEIGYCIGRKWWHKGIMSEALSEIMRFFFDDVKANRVCAEHDANNPHSGMVMAKCGLLFEGKTRLSRRNNQGLCDTCHYGLCAEDYRKK
ncbi:MAG: GNAT family N-acetyltransferase [Eubacteriales bacterium]|nr:GNAT family N-acetyltransferase [Eubacteriales bacterium]MDD3882261.1 GNAT family N-acetyltransferase [Eubacteriales bacterium]MDD4512007.1 GNAT family N-acetyltransferase [Eubacteriales bacterium]